MFVVHMHLNSRTNNCPLLAHKFCQWTSVRLLYCWWFEVHLYE